jgi:ABC-type protease/lipase transport system fused ATPase/permease subunit
MKGSDPTTFELIQKTQLLQKRLLAQIQTTIKQDTQLQESKRLYLNLRQVLARQPGPDASIRLRETQRALQDRGKKMKVI